MKAYDRLKADIKAIEQNSRKIKRLSERYNSSTGKDENQGIILSVLCIICENANT